MHMKKLKLGLAAVTMSILMASSAFAGTWTHTYTDSSGESETYFSLWFYIKDDGTYAQNEWVQDTDGTWYWVEADGSLPVTAGISTDGYLYDEDGRYIPMEGTAFLTVDQAAAITMNMTYEQVLAILGPEHSRTNSRIVFTGEGINSEATCTWFFAGGHGRYRLEFTNGAVSDIYGYFY